MSMHNSGQKEAADLAARLAALEKAAAALEESPVKAWARSDFASLLDEEMEDNLDLAEQKKALAESVRDLNISDVISQIKDEGPAGGEAEPADDVVELSSAATAQPEEQPEKANEAEAPAGTVPPQGPFGRSQAALQLAISLILVVALVGLGLVSYGQVRQQQQLGNSLQVSRQALTALNREIDALKEQTGRLASARAETADQKSVSSRSNDDEQQLRQQLAYTNLLLAALLADRPVMEKGKKADSEKPKKPLSAAGPTASKGRWMVVLRSSRDARQAERMRQELAGQVEGVAIKKAHSRGRPIYFLMVPGFANKKTALDYRNQMLKKGFKGAWVGRR